MDKTLKLLAASFACFAVLPASAQSLGDFVDAAQPLIDRGSPLVHSIGGGPSSEQKLAQTMTVEVGGNLAGIFMPILCGTGKVHVEIRDVAAGQPGPTVLDSRNVDPSVFDVPGYFIYVRIPGAVALTAGQEIAVVVSNAKGSCSYYKSPVTANYPGGQAFFDARPNPPGWVPFSAFPGEPDDLPFQLVLE